MIDGQSLIEQLEEALAQSDLGRRSETLRRVTDLFESGGGRFSSEQIALFDAVMYRLVMQIDASARVAFGLRLAAMSDGPPNVTRALALDDAIEVAGPVLRRADRLDDPTLVETAKTKSQEHLLAISRRKAVSEVVTDVLVERGNREVAVSTAKNAGARFSDFGYSTLVHRSQGDIDLALAVWVRPEIPRHHLLQLVMQAAESVRLELEAADDGKTKMLRELVAEAANQAQTKTRDQSPIYGIAYKRVLALQAAGELDAAHLAEFACAGRFEETTVTLSLLSDLPIGIIERAIVNGRTEQTLVLAKAIGLGWETTSAILQMGAGTKSISSEWLQQCGATFTRLQPDTAKKALHFYRLRERAATGNTLTLS